VGRHRLGDVGQAKCLELKNNLSYFDLHELLPIGREMLAFHRCHHAAYGPYGNHHQP
jgi:hypothetical protein